LRDASRSAPSSTERNGIEEKRKKEKSGRRRKKRKKRNLLNETREK
jgi:hypothetical protein